METGDARDADMLVGMDPPVGTDTPVDVEELIAESTEAAEAAARLLEELQRGVETAVAGAIDDLRTSRFDQPLEGAAKNALALEHRRIVSAAETNARLAALRADPARARRRADARLASAATALSQERRDAARRSARDRTAAAVQSTVEPAPVDPPDAPATAPEVPPAEAEARPPFSADVAPVPEPLVPEPAAEPVVQPPASLAAAVPEQPPEPAVPVRAPAPTPRPPPVPSPTPPAPDVAPEHAEHPVEAATPSVPLPTTVPWGRLEPLVVALPPLTHEPDAPEPEVPEPAVSEPAVPKGEVPEASGPAEPPGSPPSEAPPAPPIEHEPPSAQDREAAREPRPAVRRGALVGLAVVTAVAAFLGFRATDGSPDGDRQAELAAAVPVAPHPLPGHDRYTSVVAEATSATVDVFSGPDDQSPEQTFESPSDLGSPTVFLVTDESRDDRLEVLLPVRPNGSRGWVDRAQVKVGVTGYRVRIDLVAHTLEAFHGERLVLKAPVGIGTVDTPTPGGSFYIKELVQPPNPDTVYGTYAYGLSGFSNTLEEFNGGAGVVGIHGTNDPSGIGKDVSSGCIRLTNEDVEELVARLPLGTPVEIVPNRA